MNTVTLKQIGYLTEGESLLNLWGGGQGSIEIEPTKIKKVSKEILLACVNDNGFGVESIEEAELDIYDLFEGGYKQYNRTIHFDNKYRRDFCQWQKLKDAEIN